MKSFLFLVAILVFSFSVRAQTEYVRSVEQWRAAHEAELKDENGWLTVAGLFWLKDGVNTVGAGDGFDVELTDSFKQKKFGTIDFRNGKASLKVEDGVEALSGGRKVSEIELVSDEKGKPTAVQTGSQTFYLIRREDRYAIRLKDKNYKARAEFKGLKWFPIDPRYRVEAVFEPYPEPKEILIPNMIGGNFRMKSPGLLRFTLKGRKYSLEPVLEEGLDELFIVFRDTTSKTETYGAGRFLYVKTNPGGKITLDFNQAENPPCAYTTFATCPLPPPQNRLPIAVKAGEKRYADH